MKIAFFEIQPWEQEYMKHMLPDDDIYFSEVILTDSHLNEVTDIEGLSIFIYSKITKDILNTLPRLKFIATRSTGYDHIDIEECKRRNIIVYNVPTYGENTVAEHTFALILALSRKVHEAYIRVQRNDFSINGLKGFDLKNKTLGVIGTGHIGLHVIRIARGFGMNVLAYTHHPDTFMAEVMNYEYASFEDLMRRSDIVTLHIPLDVSTHYLINKANIHMMKKGSILINTSRGAIVETDALIVALEDGTLKGVGLDVIEGEEYIKEEKQLLHENNNEVALRSVSTDHVLFSKQNVVFTPHTGFYSQEALERILETTGQNIAAFTSGSLMNTVSL